MKKYRHIIFDADYTLIDFGEDEKRAFRAAFQNTPLDREEMIAEMREYSRENWEALGLNRVNDPTIRREYHALHYVHVHALFEYAKETYDRGLTDEKERIFFETLSSPAHPCESALETVKALSKKYAVSVATNGLSKMQRARLTEFTPYLFRLFVSEEMNAIKPAREFGNAVLRSLHARAEDCLFVGDSLVSDIALANKLGMDAVWCNPEKRELPEGYRVIKEIGSTGELINFL